MPVTMNREGRFSDAKPQFFPPGLNATHTTINQLAVYRWLKQQGATLKKGDREFWRQRWLKSVGFNPDTHSLALPNEIDVIRDAITCYLYERD